MTQQQMQYAYWQRMRQQQIYRAYVAGMSSKKTNSYKSIKKISDSYFLNYIEYEASNISPDKLNERLKRDNYNNLVGFGMCSGVYSNTQKKVLRQLDWYYNNEVEFIIKMNKCPEKKVKYDSIGVTAASPKLTKAIAQHYIDSGEYYEYFDLLPYMTVDGVNEKGIFAQSNVVERNNIEININNVEGKEDCCCSIMLVRFILDRVEDITSEEETDGKLKYELNKLHLYGIPKEYNPYNNHILVADSKGNSRIIEFKSNSFEITEYPIMTNFRTNNGFSADDSTKMPNWSSIEHNGCGVERWETAARWLSTEQDFRDLRQKLDYTNSYISCYDAQSITSAWITECLSDDLSVSQAKDYHDDPSGSDYKEIIDKHLSAYFDKYKNRSRETTVKEDKTWITTHSCIYDLIALSCNIKSQIGTNEESEWNVLSDGTVKENTESYTKVTYKDGTTRLFAIKGELGKNSIENKDQVIKIEVGNEVTSIGEEFFKECNELLSVTMPNSVKAIYSFAFQNCHNLSYAPIPSEVKIVGNSAFLGTKITTATMPDSLSGYRIEDSTFQNCTLLTAVYLPENLGTISWQAFMGCSSLSTLTVPLSVTNIGSAVFAECPNLSVTFEGRTKADIEGIYRYPWGLDEDRCIPGIKQTTGGKWTLTVKNGEEVEGSYSYDQYNETDRTWYNSITDSYVKYDVVWKLSQGETTTNSEETAPNAQYFSFVNGEYRYDFTWSQS